MDSINKEQPEKNHENLIGAEAGRKIKELVDQSTTCFFCTKLTTGEPLKTRPMAIQKVDNKGSFWFMSASDSHKNAEIHADSHVQLLFQGSDYSDFLSVYGVATISTNKALINELWNPMLKAWFTEGIDDPRITVIKVTAQDGYYWDNKHGDAIAFVKTAIGAAIGQTLDDSIEGTLTV